MDPWRNDTYVGYEVCSFQRLRNVPEESSDKSCKTNWVVTNSIMDITQVKKEAEDYLESCSGHLHIYSINEDKRQLGLASKDKKFTCFISVPGCDQESWGIWSEEQSCLSTIHLVWEICNLDTVSSITTLLQAVVRAVQKTHNKKSHAFADDLDDSDEDDTKKYYEKNYEDEDVDLDDQASNHYQKQEDEKTLAARFQDSKGPRMTIKRLIKDLMDLNSSETKSGIDASPSENDIFVWWDHHCASTMTKPDELEDEFHEQPDFLITSAPYHVKLTDIPLETKLGKDLQKYAKAYKEEPVIHLEMMFPADYPFCPPFIRVLKPRFKFLTGHVTLGGSICMQMLTKSGWQPCNNIESILIQVRSEILSDPKASLADHQTNVSYSLEDAKKAYQRMTKKVGEVAGLAVMPP
ncbi:hypothetical protein RRG08_021496 [Elysia crispata]|uniref:UBC core domain-containing protein n=1 Tax=Elysia crispata TaxID=231223 RepID=A0AAE1BBW3_9GAST|nr:hypothetical protein RRG08_021496 [Elysia crispata]